MHCHANARLTPRGRVEVFTAVEAGMTVVAACLAFRMSRRTYYRWLPRWRAEGAAGLVDRSSRPRRSPQRLSPATERQIAGLREATGFGPDRIGALLGLPASTCHRALARLGYLGWEVLHVAIDAATRLVYAELLADEKGRTTARFLVRAVRWFKARGVSVIRLLTDNGSPYRIRVFGRARRWLGLRHSRTRPYRPQTNGKAERWIRTVLSECLYVEVFHSPGERRLALERFIGYYNARRPHLGIGGLTPRQRLSQLMAAA